ncbi:uncharacterized protein OCT59_012111 [Rhizophagus irregularis]|uniref:uncharacterized protein n=1 Tax=Rhizophagus irregularis TaxID=588596 RepID=UPI0033310DA0|nr:hypothetical protein OCT59_012111 [Rhizophagus irregularis]
MALILFYNINIENDDHYAAFNSVHNTETSEPHRPSLVIALESADHVPKGLLINTKRQEFGLIENEMNYTCDSLLVSEDHILYNKLFVREKITCELPIELAYYSSISHRQGLKQLCYWCGVDGSFADPQENLVAKYKFIFPYCIWCLKNGKNYFCQVEIKTNKKKEVEVTMFNLTIGRKKCKIRSLVLICKK